MSNNQHMAKEAKVQQYLIRSDNATVVILNAFKNVEFSYTTEFGIENEHSYRNLKHGIEKQT